MRDELKEALADLRRTVSALRSAPETDLPLPEALGRLANAFEAATGLRVSLALPPQLPGLPEAHRLAIYRAAQEGLTNVQRHARAKNAWLSLQLNDGDVTLNVADDGRGVPMEEASEALRGLRERAAKLQGDVHLTNRPQGGAQLMLRLPWREMEAVSA